MAKKPPKKASSTDAFGPATADELADPILAARLESLSNVDSMFASICDDAKERFGEENVFTGREAERLMICLPLPSLSARYFFQNEGLPLMKIIMVIGEQETFKSSLCDVIASWHRMTVKLPKKTIRVGKAYKISVENKQWPELTSSLLGYDEGALDTFEAKTLDGAEDGWMPMLSKTMDAVKDQFEPIVVQGNKKGQAKEGSKGRIVPTCFIVDPVMGALSESTGEKIEKAGAPSLSFPIEARKISDYMRWMPKRLYQWPWTVLAVNHKKVSVSPDKVVTISLPGGKALKFGESIEIDMRRCGRQFERVRDGEQGVLVHLETTKNSCGPRAELDVEIVWWYDEDDVNDMGQPRQKTIFDWHSASIELLAGDWSETRKKQIAEIVDLHVNRDSRRCWSKALGIGEKSSVKWREAGAILEEHPEVLNALYNILGIRRRYLFEPGIDFRKQWQWMKDKVAAEPDAPAEAAT